MFQVLACGAAIVTLSMGIRHGFGLWLQPITMERGWTRETFAFALAVQNLAWGLAGPLAGGLADRFGAFRVLIVGSLLYALGLVLMAVACIGLGSSIFHPEASRIARLTAGMRPGFAQSLFQVGGNAGSALGPLLAAAIVVGRGQAEIAWFMLLVLVAVAVLGALDAKADAPLSIDDRSDLMLNLRGALVALGKADEAKAVAERQAVQPRLIEALTALGDKALLSEVAQNMNLVSLFRGKEAGAILSEVLGGTRFLPALREALGQTPGE